MGVPSAAAPQVRRLAYSEKEAPFAFGIRGPKYSAPARISELKVVVPASQAPRLRIALTGTAAGALGNTAHTRPSQGAPCWPRPCAVRCARAAMPSGLGQRASCVPARRARGRCSIRQQRDAGRPVAECAPGADAGAREGHRRRGKYRSRTRPGGRRVCAGRTLSAGRAGLRSHAIVARACPACQDSLACRSSWRIAEQ